MNCYGESWNSFHYLLKGKLSLVSQCTATLRLAFPLINPWWSKKIIKLAWSDESVGLFLNKNITYSWLSTGTFYPVHLINHLILFLVEQENKHFSDVLPKAGTYHPLKTSEATHLSRSVNRCHAILRPDIQWTSGFEYQIFQNFQMSLLSSQINRSHVIVHLSICSEKSRKINLCAIKFSASNWLGNPTRELNFNWFKKNSRTTVASFDFIKTHTHTHLFNSEFKIQNLRRDDKS